MKDRIIEELIKDSNRSNTAIAKVILGDDATYNKIESLRKKIAKARKQFNTIDFTKPYTPNILGETLNWFNLGYHQVPPYETIPNTTTTKSNGYNYVVDLTSTQVPEDEIITPHIQDKLHKAGLGDAAKIEELSSINYNPMKRYNNNVLVLPCIHEPFSTDKHRQHAWDVYNWYKCGKVIFLGDLVDQSALNYHEKYVEGYSAMQEHKFAKEHIQKWSSLFPEAVWILGNHDRLPQRKANTAGIPASVWLRGFNEVYDIKWQIVKNYTYNGIHYKHGEEKTAIEMAKALGVPVVQAHRHCLPDTYEVLVKDKGFINIKNVLESDIVYGYKDGKIVESNVLEVITGTYSGEMYKFDNFLKQEVTSNHHFYTKDEQYVELKDYLELDVKQMVISALPLDRDDFPISDNLLRILIAVCADGSYTKNSIRFHLKKERKINRLSELFYNEGETINWVKNPDGTYRNTILNLSFIDKIKTLIPKKTLPAWFKKLSSRQINIILEEICLWDGYKNINKRVTNTYYCSYKKEERDLIQELCALNGVFSKSSNDKVVYWNDKKSPLGYKNQIKRIKTLKHSTKQVIDLPIACLRTSTNNFIIRTDSKTVELTGNSEHYVRSISQNIWGVQTGVLFDKSAYAFHYAKENTDLWVESVLVVKDKTPILERCQ